MMYATYRSWRSPWRAKRARETLSTSRGTRWEYQGAKFLGWLQASIPWSFGTFWLAIMLGNPPLTAQAITWREAPEYLQLFTPQIHRESYRAYVSPKELDDILASLNDDPMLVRTPGGWEARALLAVDAFGRSGDYDRVKLARLYGGRRPRVVRGPRQENGGAIESWTLVSPYPSATLEHLESGTLRIVLRLP